VPEEAKVQFVVNWWDKDSKEQYAVVLPVLRMKKRGKQS